MMSSGDNYTPQQRKALEVLHSFGALSPHAFAARIPTDQSGLSRIVSHLDPLIAWANEPEMFFIPREQRRKVYDLVSRWQG